MKTLQVVNAEYATNHHLGFSGVLETSDSVVDEENLWTKSSGSSAVDKEKSSIQDAFQLYVKDVIRAELLDRKQESALAKKIEFNRQKIEGILFGSKLVFDENFTIWAFKFRKSRSDNPFQNLKSSTQNPKP